MSGAPPEGGENAVPAAGTDDHSGLAAVAAAAAACAASAASAAPPGSAPALMPGMPGMPAGVSHQDLMAAALMQMALQAQFSMGFEGLAGVPLTFPPGPPPMPMDPSAATDPLAPPGEAVAAAHAAALAAQRASGAGSAARPCVSSVALAACCARLTSAGFLPVCCVCRAWTAVTARPFRTRARRCARATAHIAGAAEAMAAAGLPDMAAHSAAAAAAAHGLLPPGQGIKGAGGAGRGAGGAVGGALGGGAAVKPEGPEGVVKVCVRMCVCVCVVCLYVYVYVCAE